MRIPHIAGTSHSSVLIDLLTEFNGFFILSDRPVFTSYLRSEKQVGEHSYCDTAEASQEREMLRAPWREEIQAGPIGSGSGCPDETESSMCLSKFQEMSLEWAPGLGFPLVTGESGQRGRTVFAAIEATGRNWNT